MKIRLHRRAFLAGSLAFPVRAMAGTRKPLRFGLTPVFLDNDTQLLDKLQRYLSRATGGPVVLVQRRSYQEITVLLLAGQLDAAWICGYPFVQYRDRLSLVAVPSWQGAPLYRSYVIVPRDSDAGRFEDLRNTIHAFSDPDSNSGYLVTTALLLRRGERPGSFFRHVFFTYGHRNVVRAVARGLAQGGSVDGYVFEVLRRTEPELGGSCRVLRRSEPFGFPPIACPRTAADTPVIRRLAGALLDADADPLGRDLLATLHLDGFVAADDSLYAGIARNAALLSRST